MGHQSVSEFVLEHVGRPANAMMQRFMNILFTPPGAWE